MKYSAINIQGNIISGEILEKIRTDSIKFQARADFGLDKNTSLRDEIGVAWSTARAYWQAFSLRRGRLKDSDTGISDTRQGWMIPFLREFGYELEKSTAEIINGKTYAISHRAFNRNRFPVHIAGINQSLDKRAEIAGTRLSPHALVQEYLNNHEDLYSIVTNGRFLRLLRDATRLSRLSYLEFDLERIMEEDLFAEFALMFRVLHISRMPVDADEAENSHIEYYHQEALDSGSRIREKLSEAVEQSLKILANGLLKHPENEELRERVMNGQLGANDFYLYLLRSVYRLLFLMVIEERHLIYPEKRDEDINRKRDIYFNYYSINRLTGLAEKYIYTDPQKTDLWHSVLATFLLFENGFYGEKLGIKPLGSGLFAADALGSLVNCRLDNGTLLKVLRLLVTFENENQQRVRVNYADLDVEEFGSVYEGLLDYDPSIREINGSPEFYFVKGEGRSSSGSHYTPEELVKPLIKHSLEYLISDCTEKPEERLNVNLQDKNKKVLQEKALLSLKVADVACGSGHILLSAARRIALELARVRTGEDQPSPPALRKATRDVICTCIYGVDLNPLAVELCKVALWLEAHNPGEPLNFLDHRIKCGNAIVGLAHKEELSNGIADEAFKSLPGDDKGLAAAFRKKNKDERTASSQIAFNFENTVDEPLTEILNNLEQVLQMPETTPEEIERKHSAYNRMAGGERWWRLKTLADMQAAQFFIPKNEDNKGFVVTDGQYREYLNGSKSMNNRAVSHISALAHKKRFFHWFLEFPAVMGSGGFDCILGNPPFLGGQKITGTYGNAFAELIKYYYAPIGSVDLVTYFFRRIFGIVKENGFQSLISTNTIAQGDARVGGLAQIIEQNGIINHAVRSMKWPGLAAVEVALVTVHKGEWKGKFILSQKEVEQITSYLDDSIPLGDPFPLKANEGKSFQGSIVLGKGFVMAPEEAQKLIDKDPKNSDVLFPYLNGDDLNNQIGQSPSRWVINFKDWPLRRYTMEEWDAIADNEKEDIYKKLLKGSTLETAPPDYRGQVAADYPDCLEIVERLVKKEREKTIEAKIKNGQKPSNENIEAARLWWRYHRAKLSYYNNIVGLKRIITLALTSKTVAFEFMQTRIVFSHATGVISTDSNTEFNLLQSTINNVWAWKNASSMKGDLRYTPSNCYETYPFPQNISTEKESNLEAIGKNYHEHRQQLMQKIQLGLTKTYNQFHNSKLEALPAGYEYQAKAFEKKYGKESHNLWKHLEKNENTCSYNEAAEEIIKLRELHREMDLAVLDAYGWNDIDLAHDFYEVDYLPENDRIRYTLSPEARKEVLKRLLLLNHERYEEEIKQGLHKKNDVEKFYAQKGEALPEGIVFSDKKGKTGKKVKKKKFESKGQQGLF